MVGRMHGRPNVEAQVRNPSSFLQWLQRALQVRKRHNETFGMGSFEILEAENPSVFAFIRTEGDDMVVCANNLSRFAQPVELNLQRWEGRTPIELLGRVPFPRIGELPYFITLQPYSFFWFQLT